MVPNNYGSVGGVLRATVTSAFLPGDQGVKELLNVRQIFLVVLAVLIGWRILASGVSAYFLQLAAEGDPAAADKVVASSLRRPEAKYEKALSILEQDPADAAALLKRSYAENPAAAAPLLALAQIAQSDGDQEQAAALVEKASQLRPVDPNIQLDAGNYWLQRGNLGAAMKHWTRVIEAYPAASEKLFPILLKLVEEPRTRGAFEQLAASPPTWWERFFAETARRALDLETVRTLWAFRRATDHAPITREERNIYARRLKKEGKIPEAYLVWVNGLDETERSHLGILYNGSFEVEPSGSGFDWHLRATSRVTATTAATTGVEGKKALHLIFRGREKRFGHVHQPLFLDPGAYGAAGRVRTDSFDSIGGLKWVVRCLSQQAVELGESERFLGSSDWRNFSFELLVPDNCTAQEIRLVSAGRRDFEHKATGGIWFDSMSMRKAPASTAKVGPSIPGESNPLGRTQDPPGHAIHAIEVNADAVFRFQPSMTEGLSNSKQSNQ